MLGVGQGVLMLLFGIFLVGLELSIKSAMFILGSMALARTTFIAFGSVIAAFSRKSDIAGYVFFFTIMPLTFLASFPLEMLPESINAFTPWLPTSMALELIGHFFISDKFHPDLLFAGFGLLAYAIVLLLVSRMKNFAR